MVGHRFRTLVDGLSLIREVNDSMHDTLKLKLAPVLFVILINSCARGLPKDDNSRGSAEEEIRAALCDLRNHDFTGAQKRIEAILKSDPNNEYALRVLPSTLARQIKTDDKSPQNIALVNKALAAYEIVAKNPKTSSFDREQIERFTLRLLGMVGPDQKRAELLRRAKDPLRTAKDRSNLYGELAGDERNCVFRITRGPSPPSQADLEQAKVCVEHGLEYANEAIAVNGETSSAWFLKATLLKYGVDLADRQRDMARKATYQQQADDADKRVRELSAREIAEREKVETKREAEQKKNDSFAAEDDMKTSELELTEYKKENSLNDAIEKIFMPDLESSRDAPVPNSEKSDGKPESRSQTQAGCFKERENSATVQEKRNWKTFSPPNKAFTADLPDNVCSRAGGYTAASEGIMYEIFSLDRPALSSEAKEVDAVMNTITRSFAAFNARAWVNVNDGATRVFEIKLSRKEDLNGEHRRVYSYALSDCGQRKYGVLIVHAGPTRYSTVDISGATESDPRIQRFLKSLTFK
jgi:hypothetical protein